MTRLGDNVQYVGARRYDSTAFHISVYVAEIMVVIVRTDQTTVSWVFVFSC